MTTRPLFAAAFAALALSMIGCAASSDSTDSGDDTEQAMSAYTSSKKIVGDWGKLQTGYECLAAMQYFYPAKFGVSLPLAGSHWTGSCAPHGACHIWLDEIPSSSQWERIPNDGNHVPETYDVIVYPPIGSDVWGHIASVDHVEGKTIYVMDDNYVGHHEKSKLPHTVSWPAYGWYHLKKLGNESNPSPPVKKGGDCVAGGTYCGGDKVIGNAGTLYKCLGNGEIEEVQACAHGCAVRAGEDDVCRPCVVGGFYCGGDKISGNSSTLYKCTSEGTGEIVEHCAKGCAVNAFSDDSCK